MKSYRFVARKVSIGILLTTLLFALAFVVDGTARAEQLADNSPASSEGEEAEDAVALEALEEVDEPEAIEDAEPLGAIDTDEALEVVEEEEPPPYPICFQASGDKSGATDADYWTHLSNKHKKYKLTLYFEPGKKYYFNESLNVWNNWTIIGDGAEIYEVTPNHALFVFGESVGNPQKTLTDDSLGRYGRCKNITIDGGIYHGSSKTKNTNGSFFQFMHGENITIKNCAIILDGGGHSIELAGIRHGVISNVRFRGSYDSTDATNEVIQLDATATKGNTPAGAPWDNTPCSDITIRDCDINVSKQPIGVGTSNGPNMKANHTGIKIQNNTICATRYTVALLPSSKGAQITGNKLYKGSIYTPSSQGATIRNNTTNGTWPKANPTVQLTSENIRTNPTSYIDTFIEENFDGYAEPDIVLTGLGKKLRVGTDVRVSYTKLTYDGFRGLEVRVAGKGAKYCGYVSLYCPRAQKYYEYHRLYGDNALGTMEAVVQAGWGDEDRGGAVVITTRTSYKDALAAAGYAGTLGNGAPVMLTDGRSLSDQTCSELQRLQPSTVYIVGGTAAVSTEVERQIQSAVAADVKRIGGKDSIDTANRLARAGKGTWSSSAFMVTNASYKDALSTASIAYALGMPVFLTNGKSLTPDTQRALKECGITRVVVVGGTSAITPGVYEAARKAAGSAERAAGNNAIATSVAVATWGLNHGMSKNSLGVATSQGYADALSGAAFCGRKRTVLVLSSEANTSGAASISTIVGRNVRKNGDLSPAQAYLFGGIKAIGYVEEIAINSAYLK